MNLQLPPLVPSEISLLLAVVTIILLITAELTSSRYGLTNLNINKKKLRDAALAAGMLLLITIMLEIIGLVVYS